MWSLLLGKNYQCGIYFIIFTLFCPSLEFLSCCFLSEPNCLVVHVFFIPKAYLDYFSRALAYEYRPKGVIVQCLLPFYVATRMTQYSETLSNPSLFIPTATTYARHALKTLGWSTRTTGYWPHTLQVSKPSVSLRRLCSHLIRD